MKLEYDENQEKELRITEIEAILENDLYENEVDELCLEIELQFLQGSENAYGESYAMIGTDNASFDVIYDEGNNIYSATLYDKEGNPQLPYLNEETLNELVEQILKIENGRNLIMWKEKYTEILIEKMMELPQKILEDTKLFLILKVKDITALLMQLI